jgi:hypothetical protein
MAFCAGAALLGRGQSPAVQAVAFGIATAVLAALAIWVDWRWARLAKNA